ncbi:MAG: DNA-protecting protein DprA [Actinomycetota bacterium]|nr:DNA-protecting protein DprA [Actinomycetota bacterium]
MSELETAALVALLRVGRGPASVYAELVEVAGSALPVLKRECREAHDGQTSLLAPDAEALVAQAATDVGGWNRQGMALLTVLDDDYPVNLRAVHDRPPLIFVAGKLRPADQRSVAVIGSRRATPGGLDLAHELAGDLAARGYTIISGLAAGIDTTAHQAALARAARTVAVIGTGLLHSYPEANAALQRQIADQGAVVSQFWPDAPPAQESFPKRNAVMSGLSCATVIVEASAKSGARVQARLALRQGRPVFLHAALLEQEWARELAHRPAVNTYSSADDIDAALQRLSRPGLLTP